MTSADELPEIPATAWALLGVLSFGEELSGYDIGRWAESSLAFFYWKPSPSQVYAELRRLERLGLSEAVGPADDPRRKQLYRITPTGTAALREWLATSEPGPTMLKHPTALRVWLGHLMEPERLRAMVAGHRDELAASAEAASKAAAVSSEREGWEYPALITSWSERSYRRQYELMTELLGELDRLAEQPASRPRRGRRRQPRRSTTERTSPEE